MKKNDDIAALVLEFGKKREAGDETEVDDFEALASEIISMSKDGDAEGLAQALKDFVYMCSMGDEE